MGNDVHVDPGQARKNVYTLIQDLRHAARMLRRNPGFTTLAILALAVGIGANTAVFTVVNGVLLRPLPFPGAERLFLLSCAPRRSPLTMSPGLTEQNYLEVRRQNRSFEQIATFSSLPATVTGAGEPLRIPGATVTPDFFTVLRVNPSIGRRFLTGEDQPGRNDVAILSDALWRTRFGADFRVIGKTITLDGIVRTVIGVMPADFGFPNDAQVWTPLAIRIDPHTSILRPVVGRLKPGVSPQEASSEFEALIAGVPPPPSENRNDWTVSLLPLKELMVSDIRMSLLIFSGAVAFVLLIACANVANLMLMRAASRRQELAVRAALGAGRWRLIRLFLTEGMLLSIGGACAGMILALWAIPLLLALAPAGRIPRIGDIRIDGWVLASTLAISVLTGIASGLAPAFRMTRGQAPPSSSLGARSSMGRRERLRAVLVVAEIALALVLLTGAGLMLKSFLRLRAVDPGFRPDNVLTMTVDLPPSVYETSAQIHPFYECTLSKLSHLPGVVAAGAVNWRPLGGALIIGDFQIEGGHPLPKDYRVDKTVVSPGYFRAMGIRLLRGRDFDDRDNANAPRVAIISESVARHLGPGEDPLGERISMEDHPKPEDWLTIVGVVDDIIQEDLTKRRSAAIYRPYLQVSQPFFLQHVTFVVRAASNPQILASGMRTVLREVDKNQPVETTATMNEFITAKMAEPLFQTRLLAAFSAIALLLSAIGIYGVLAYSVAERTREIGIRMAVGALKGDVMGMVLRYTLKLAGTGIVLGLAGAFAVTRVLGTFLFGVKPTDGPTLFAVTVLLTIVALIAAWIPARRATSVDPSIALRYE